MADTEFPLRTDASAEIEGEKVSADHSQKTYDLISQAQQELRDWNVKWGAKPKSDGGAVEAAHFWREKNADAIKQFQADRRFTDEKGRVHNLMHIDQFCRKLHNILGYAADGGSRIFINTPPPIPHFDNTKMKGLFVKVRGMDNFIYHTDLLESLGPGWKKICAIQVPYMSEWGIMNLDERGCFKSWKYVGWRGNVLLRLILAEVITLEEAHNEFGAPQGTDTDKEYFKILEAWKHGKRTTN
jgi:hypothetical protein